MKMLHVDLVLQELVMKMLHVDPAARITAEQVLKDPWISDKDRLPNLALQRQEASVVKVGEGSSGGSSSSVMVFYWCC